MSHITTVELKIKDIECAAKACERLGLEFRRNQRTFKWFGRFVGDTDDAALRALGLSRADYGKCEHAIGIPGDSKAYEAGLVKDKDGNYVLLFDYWMGGFGLMARIGTPERGSSIKNANLFNQAYATEVTIQTFRRAGHRVRETVSADGKVIVEALVRA